MSKRSSFPPEFRQKIVELHRAGRSVKELAQQFEPGAQTIRNWIKQNDVDAGRRADGLSTSEREELASLRRENRRLQIEQEILKKAAADSTGRRNVCIQFSYRRSVLQGLSGAFVETQSDAV